MNKMDDLERFDDDTNTIETMTELTGVTGDTGFSSTTSNAPTSESDFTTMPTEKKKSNLPKILGGVVGLCVLAGAAVLSASSEDDNSTQNVQETQVASEVETSNQGKAAVENQVNTVADNNDEVPSLEKATQPTTTENNTADTMKVETAVVQNEPKTISDTNTLPQNTQADIVMNNPQNTVMPNNANNIGTKEVKVNPEQTVTNAQPTTVPVETQNVEKPLMDNNVNNTVLESDKLRAEAKKMLAQADALDNKGNIESLLAGKTPDEQILLLKQKLEDVQLELSKRQVCKNTEKKNSHFNKKSVRAKKSHKNPMIQESKYNVTGIVEGQIWVKNGNHSKSYVVGDKLPNGSKIKSINFDSKTIVTNQGTFKAY